LPRYVSHSSSLLPPFFPPLPLLISASPFFLPPLPPSHLCFLVLLHIFLLKIKLRVEKAYDEHGVHAEDCLVEAEGKQYRSFAVEGTKEKVVAFLSSHAVGKKMYEQATTEKGAVLHGYPGFVCKCACL